MASAGFEMQNENEKYDTADSVDKNSIMPWRELKDKVEKDYIINVLNHTAKDIPSTSRLSGLSRARIYQLIKKYEIS